MKIFFFQTKKKEAKKSLGHLRLCPKPRNAFLLHMVCGLKPRPTGEVAAQADKRVVGTGVPDCPKRTATGSCSRRTLKIGTTRDIIISFIKEKKEWKCQRL